MQTISSNYKEKGKETIRHYDQHLAEKPGVSVPMKRLTHQV